MTRHPIWAIPRTGANGGEKGFFQRLRRGAQHLADFHEQAVFACLGLYGETFLGQFIGQLGDNRVRHQRVDSVRRRLT